MIDVELYKYHAQNSLSNPHCGGTDWQFAETVAPMFEEVLRITGAGSILEFGFNCGGSALMFLMHDAEIIYHSIDIVDAPESAEFLSGQYSRFTFEIADSRSYISDKQFDLVFIDADHSESAVLADIESALTAQPHWLLFDDVLHPSHKYIYDIIKDDERLCIEKIWTFNELWEGYSMALCKVNK